MVVWFDRTGQEVLSQRKHSSHPTIFLRAVIDIDHGRDFGHFITILHLTCPYASAPLHHVDYQRRLRRVYLQASASHASAILQHHPAYRGNAGAGRGRALRRNTWRPKGHTYSTSLHISNGVPPVHVVALRSNDSSTLLP